jgi:5'-phosphate synthase pdxT subunit
VLPNRTASLNVAGNGSPTVGVLAFQGDYREHLTALGFLGVEARSVRRQDDLDAVSGLIIPGGESTVIDKLSRTFGLADPVRKAIRAGMPVFGTCAGLIMIADRIIDGVAGQQSFGGLDIAVRRNAFGHQNDSFETEIRVGAIDGPPMHAIFIRAPVVDKIGREPKVLARLDDERVVAVEQGNLLGTSFHPEMTNDYRLHEYFINKVRIAAFRR